MVHTLARAQINFTLQDELRNLVLEEENDIEE
jgi:hypothetical protein